MHCSSLLLVLTLSVGESREVGSKTSKMIHSFRKRHNDVTCLHCFLRNIYLRHYDVWFVPCEPICPRPATLDTSSPLAFDLRCAGRSPDRPQRASHHFILSDFIHISRLVTAAEMFRVTRLKIALLTHVPVQKKEIKK